MLIPALQGLGSQANPRRSSCLTQASQANPLRLSGLTQASQANPLRHSGLRPQALRLSGLRLSGLRPSSHRGHAHARAKERGCAHGFAQQNNVRFHYGNVCFVLVLQRNCVPTCFQQEPPTQSACRNTFTHALRQNALSGRGCVRACRCFAVA